MYVRTTYVPIHIDIHINVGCTGFAQGTKLVTLSTDLVPVV